jgi:hypothetical protein
MTVHRLRMVPAPPPVPTFKPNRPVRPGERREPLPTLTIDLRFADAAATRGLSVAVAVELALERALVLADLELVGQGDRYADLLSSARNQRFVAPLAAPYRHYRSALRDRSPRDLDKDELNEPTAVPLRLFPRVLEIDYELALDPSVIDDAVALELAALCAGRTMSEYGLLFAAALV